MGLVESFAADRRAVLVALRLELAGAIADARMPDENGRSQPSAVAALSKELRAVEAELATLSTVEVSKADVIADELAVARARAAGGAAAADRAPAARRGQSRRSNGNHRTG